MIFRTRIRKSSSVYGWALLTWLLASCAPTADQLREVIKKNPDVVFEAIKADPGQFMDVVQSAARDAQQSQAQKQAQEEEKQFEAEFANPKKPDIDEKRTFFGPKSAPITIVEYSDFECPYCSRGYQTVKQVKSEYGDKVRILFKHLPLDFHPMAMPAAQYYEAVAKQSGEKAEKFHDLIFENQGELKSKKEAFLESLVKKVGADLAKVKKDINSDAIQKMIAADTAEAQKFGISGTPGFIINGVTLRGAYPFPKFKEIIDRHLQK